MQKPAISLGLAAKSLVFTLALTPFLWLVFRALTDRLSVNPVEDITLTTGIWALRFLVMSIAITPVRRITGWNRLVQYRRMLGLFAFFYALLHVTTYFALDLYPFFDQMAADLTRRPFIIAGLIAFLTMVPLAMTSTKGWIRRLGRRWQLLHRLVYISALAAGVHYLWKVKVMIGSPVYYLALIALLLLFRALWVLRARASRRLQAAAG